MPDGELILFWVKFSEMIWEAFLGDVQWLMVSQLKVVFLQNYGPWSVIYHYFSISMVGIKLIV